MEKECVRVGIIFSIYFLVEKVLLVVVLVVFYKEDGEIDYERYVSKNWDLYLFY